MSSKKVIKSYSALTIRKLKQKIKNLEFFVSVAPTMYRNDMNGVIWKEPEDGYEKKWFKARLKLLVDWSESLLKND